MKGITDAANPKIDLSANDERIAVLTIKKAWLSDLEELMKWRIEVLSEVFAPLDPAIVPTLEASNRAYYREALANGTHEACFAMLDGKIVGCGGICYQQEMPSPDNHGGHCAYLMNIYVRPQYRHLGIGRQITQWLTSQASARHIEKIYLEASVAGRSLYSNLDFCPMPDMMQLKRP